MEDEEKEIPQCQNPIGGIPTLLTSSKNASIFHLTEQSKTKCRFFFFRIVIVLFLYSPVACLHCPDWRYNAAGVSSKRKKDALVVNNRDVLRLPSYQKKRGEDSVVNGVANRK